jgi:NAD(P)-dependent dehydrogenase (short-subunit alcohol dehydrogenase family)
MSGKKTTIITGASGGIGAGLVEGFLREGYNVVATSREANRMLTSSGSLVLLDGDIGKQQTAAYAVEAAINNFGTIDVLVNNAGIFLTKSFTDFTTEDFDALVSTNLLGLKDSNQTLDFDEVRMPRLLSVNVGLPRDVTWNGKTVRTSDLEISS